ncbi:hypothetical protein BGX28_009758 [Mortierella sp. GBA30]|nr:hypothetical protein BGX28_009758 [Mortierella sp. GBA30]
MPIVPSYSNQALRTFAPKQMSYVPDACMVPIRGLQPEKTFVLDQVVHIWTDEVKMNSKLASGHQASMVPSTTSPFFLSLNEGKVGHKIELGNEVEMATMFNAAPEANAGGVVPSLSIKQVLDAFSSIGTRRFNLVVCVKKVSMYMMKPQITLGYQTHIQVNPNCKNVEVDLIEKPLKDERY